MIIFWNKKSKFIKNNKIVKFDIPFSICDLSNIDNYIVRLKDSDSAIVVQGLELNSIFDMTIDELKHFNICNTPNPIIRKRLNNGFSKVEIKN